jgi:hypothetical protein
MNEGRLSLESDSYSANQDSSQRFIETEASLSCSKETTFGSYPELYEDSPNLRILFHEHPSTSEFISSIQMFFLIFLCIPPLLCILHIPSSLSSLVSLT